MKIDCKRVSRIHLYKKLQIFAYTECDQPAVRYQSAHSTQGYDPTNHISWSVYPSLSPPSSKSNRVSPQKNICEDRCHASPLIPVSTRQTVPPVIGRHFSSFISAAPVFSHICPAPRGTIVRAPAYIASSPWSRHLVSRQKMGAPFSRTIIDLIFLSG